LVLGVVVLLAAMVLAAAAGVGIGVLAENALAKMQRRKELA
jgi:hypothetical protein